jgi:hypothetical protein
MKNYEPHYPDTLKNPNLISLRNNVLSY